MSRIHLFRASGRHNDFRPESLDLFAICSTGTTRVVERVSVLTVVNVSLKVHFADKKLNELSVLFDVRKRRGNAFNEVSAILTANIIGNDMSYVCLVRVWSFRWVLGFRDLGIGPLKCRVLVLFQPGME